MKTRKFSNLSPLESDILKLLWRKDKARVREIHNTIKRNKKVALTSVAVLLDRLHKKKLVQREIEKGRGGFHYIYYPAYSEIGFKKSIVQQTVDQLIKSFGPVAISYFNEKFSKRKKR